MNFDNGEIVSGVVTGVEKYGFFVTFGEVAKGMVHISEISYDYVADVHAVVKLGDIINARVIDNSLGLFMLKLSIKDVDYQRKICGEPIRIKQTGRGFAELNNMLPIWVEREKDKKGAN